MSWVVRQLVKELVYTMFITKNRALFHFQWRRNLLQHQKVSKYYENNRRFLIVSVGYILLPQDFHFKSPSNLFWLDLEITIPVFVKLSGISFLFNQLTRCFKSASPTLFSFLIELLSHNRLVSPAKW